MLVFNNSIKRFTNFIVNPGNIILSTKCQKLKTDCPTIEKKSWIWHSPVWESGRKINILIQLRSYYIKLN
jgi:hypothetical protein